MIGIDWGTTNLRGWAFDDSGAVIAARTGGQGISAIAHGDFAGALHALIQDWTDGSVPIVLGGMIGSRQGWREAPYIACPTTLAALAAGAMPIDTGIGSGWIVPGLSYIDAAGVADVMRGEEVQLLGAEMSDGIAVLPGTHSKWVTIAEDNILAFRTFMTGELFALLQTHSLLGRLMATPVPGTGPDWAAFDKGVRRALVDPSLTALLFSVRTEGLFAHLTPEALPDYLSGLLIGAELAGVPKKDAVTIVGAGPLATRYDRALTLAGCTGNRIIAGDDAAARGLWRIGATILEGIAA
jgi:2-dehydro-3-deoxygalactonokinase